MKPSVTHNTKHRVAGKVWKINWKACDWNRWWSNLGFYPGIFSERLRKNTENLSSDQYPGRNLCPALTQYMLEVLRLEKNSLGLRVMLHHSAINRNVTEVTHHKNCRVMLPHDHQENTNTTLHKHHKKTVSAIHMDPNRQTSILLTHVLRIDWNTFDNNKMGKKDASWRDSLLWNTFSKNLLIVPDNGADKHCFASTQHYA
jgi:hypothetical protein